MVGLQQLLLRQLRRREGRKGLQGLHAKGGRVLLRVLQVLLGWGRELRGLLPLRLPGCQRHLRPARAGRRLKGRWWRRIGATHRVAVHLGALCAVFAPGT